MQSLFDVHVLSIRGQFEGCSKCGGPQHDLGWSGSADGGDDERDGLLEGRRRMEHRRILKSGIAPANQT